MRFTGASSIYDGTTTIKLSAGSPFSAKAARCTADTANPSPSRRTVSGTLRAKCLSASSPGSPAAPPLRPPTSPCPRPPVEPPASSPVRLADSSSVVSQEFSNVSRYPFSCERMVLDVSRHSNVSHKAALSVIDDTSPCDWPGFQRGVCPNVHSSWGVSARAGTSAASSSVPAAPSPCTASPIRAMRSSSVMPMPRAPTMSKSPSVPSSSSVSSSAASCTHGL